MGGIAKILLVDDDPLLIELGSAKLAQAGYQPLAAANGAEALAILKAGGADLVISDIEMPVMDGYKLTAEIRRDAATAMTPVIVITGSDRPEAVDKAFAAGATSFLSKPINWTLFTQAARFVLKASDDQKQLKFARDQAEAGARFKDSLMSVMSHELRTPLNAIIGFGQLLGDQFERDNDHLHKEYAEYIVEGGKRLLNSVSDMLLASDARTGPIAINEADCTVEEVFDLALAPLEKTIAAAGADVKLAIQNPGLELRCDRPLIARAVGKLIDNAVKFSPRGVKIIVGGTVTKAGSLALVVKDTGPGIAPDRLATITQPFAQSDMSLRRSKEGLGLGLPLVQAIAVAHGAQFKLESELGAGARAIILLPSTRILAKGPAAAVAAA